MPVGHSSAERRSEAVAGVGVLGCGRVDSSAHHQRGVRTDEAKCDAQGCGDTRFVGSVSAEFGVGSRRCCHRRSYRCHLGMVDCRRDGAWSARATAANLEVCWKRPGWLRPVSGRTCDLPERLGVNAHTAACADVWPPGRPCCEGWAKGEPHAHGRVAHEPRPRAASGRIAVMASLVGTYRVRPATDADLKAVWEVMAENQAVPPAGEQEIRAADVSLLHRDTWRQMMDTSDLVVYVAESGNGLFAVEGVVRSARRWPGRGRGLPRMEVTMISGSKCSGSGWSPIGRFSCAGLSSPTDGVVAADARARPGTRWSGGWRTSRSGGGPRCWRSASADTGVTPPPTTGTRTDDVPRAVSRRRCRRSSRAGCPRGPRAGPSPGSRAGTPTATSAPCPAVRSRGCAGRRSRGSGRTPPGRRR